MNLVTISQLTKQYGERTLLDSVDLRINSGERIGLLGRNGSGKTTLLRLIAGLETPDAGELTIWGKVRVRYLPQKPELDPQLTVLDTLFSSDLPEMVLLRDYEALSFALEENPQQRQVQEKLMSLSERLTITNGWAAESRAKAILTRLGITGFEAPVGTLSGGQRRRVALAQALIDPGDLLILDEPTNHIDAATVAWLEEFLAQMSGSLLMVTHDRYFLERVANRIVELDRRQLISYSGSYASYLEARATREEQLAQQEEKRQSLLKRELAWLRRGAQARSTKQKARKQRIAELQKIKYDKNDSRVALALAGRRLGKRVLEARGLSKGYGSLQLFEQLDFQLMAGDRIGIVGENGTGKSTFLDVLAGKTAPDSGELSWGETVELGYFDQQSEDLLAHGQSMVIDYFEDIAPLVLTKDGERITAPQMLEWFLFPRNEQRTQIGRLSGGERRRLYLLRTLVNQPNVLFLDEPTNDLDLQTLSVLEEYLDHFSGVLVVVSHDRYFLDRNVDFIMPFADGVLGTRYPSPYRPELEKEALEEPKGVTLPVQPPSEAGRRQRDKQKLSWKEARELEALDARLPTLEAEIAALEAGLNQHSSDYEKLMALSAELQGKQAELEAGMERWLALSERVF